MIKQELVIWTIDEKRVGIQHFNPIELLKLKQSARLPDSKMIITSNGNTTVMDIKDIRYEYYDEDEQRQKTKGDTW